MVRNILLFLFLLFFILITYGVFSVRECRNYYGYMVPDRWTLSAEYEDFLRKILRD